jgi:hypothetical protein
MSNLYVNQKEYDFLVNLIEEAMLTRGEIDSDGYDCSDSLLKKLGYPEVYRNGIWNKIVCKDFLYKERCKVPSHYNRTPISHQCFGIARDDEDDTCERCDANSQCLMAAEMLSQEEFIRRDERIKTLIENNVYKFRCENCGIFAKTLSLHCSNCGKEGYLCGSFKDEDLKKWLEDHV